MGFCSHFLRSSKRACYPPKPSPKLLRQSVAIKNQRPPPIRTPVPFHNPEDLSYRTTWIFSNSVPIATVTTGRKISLRRHLCVNPVLPTAILHRHFLPGSITANYKHNPTLKSNIWLTGRPQSATICRQNKGIEIRKIIMPRKSCPHLTTIRKGILPLNNTLPSTVSSIWLTFLPNYIRGY